MYKLDDDKRTVRIYDVIKTKIIKFSELKKYDIFSLIEPNGDLVKNEQNGPLFKATSNVYLNDEGVYKIDCESYGK